MKQKVGLTTIFNIIEYPKALEQGLEVLYPDTEDYDKAIELMSSLFKVGKPIPATDVIIAAMCINKNLMLVTKDKHFKHVRLVEKGFKFVME